MLTLDTPVNKFRRHLEDNSIHPFRETDPDIYELPGNYGSFYIPLTLCCVVACVTVIYYVFIPVDEYVIFAILCLLCLAYTAWYQRKRRLYILDSTLSKYKFYIGDNLDCEGQYHNIYIRLEARNPRMGKTYYRLVLDGYQLEDRHLTSYGSNYSNLYGVGRQLASALNLNFFDYKNKSKNHVIRHRSTSEGDLCHC